MTGMIWGRFFNRTENMDRLMGYTAVTGAGLGLTGAAAGPDISWMPIGDYGRCGFQGRLIIVGFVFVWPGLFLYDELFISNCLRR